MPPNYRQLLQQSWTYLTRYRIFWGLGLLGAISTGLNTIPATSSKVQDIGSCLWLLVGLAAIVVVVIASLGVVRATAQLARTGQPPPFSVAWQTGRAKFWQYFLLGILYVLVVIPLVLLELLLPMGVRPLASWLLIGLTAALIEPATCALVLDDLAATPALASGWRFIRAYWRAALGIVGIGLASSLMQRLLLAGLAVLPGLLLDGNADVGTRLGLDLVLFVAGTLVAAPLLTFQSILWTLFYRDRRPLPPLEESPLGTLALPLEGVETRRLGPAWRPTDETQPLT